jgi:hypothetical protein
MLARVFNSSSPHQSLDGDAERRAFVFRAAAPRLHRECSGPLYLDLSRSSCPNPTAPRARSDGHANTCRAPTRRAAEARRGASYARSCTRAARAAGEADAARAPARSSFSSVSQRAPRAHGNTYAGATTPPTRTTAHAQRRRCSFALKNGDHGRSPSTAQPGREGNDVEDDQRAKSERQP